MPLSKKPTIIDLFAGAGGLSLGAVRTGFDLALAVEIDKHALATHTKNFPSSKHLAMSVADLTGDILLRHANLMAGQLDGLIGGPPCQGFSVIGHRTATDPRNNLFVKFFDLVHECQPKFFIAENVPGILEKKYESILNEAFAKVGNYYKILPPMRIKASDFGVPTVRERVFFVGYRSCSVDTMNALDFVSRRLTPVTVSEALSGLPEEINDEWIEEQDGFRPIEDLPQSDYFKKISGKIPNGIGNPETIHLYKQQKLVSGCLGTRHSVEVRERYAALQPGQKDCISKAVRLSLGGFCPTLRAGTDAERGSFQAVRPIHPTQHRVITPREAARLQGFPDWFRFAPSKWHSFRQIGNSVSPIIAEMILANIKIRMM